MQLAKGGNPAVHLFGIVVGIVQPHAAALVGLFTQQRASRRHSHGLADSERRLADAVGADGPGVLAPLVRLAVKVGALWQLGDVESPEGDGEDFSLAVL